MRRAVILVVVFGLVELLRPLGSAGYGSQALLTFGFLILAAYTVGEIAKAMRGPAIVGYMVAGVVFGPEALGTVSQEALSRLAPVSALAVALIAFLAGSELRWEELRDHGIALLKVMTAELVLGFVALSAALYAGHGYVPFMRDLPPAQVLAVSVLVASIAIVHSPAVTMALLTETCARVSVAPTTLGVVLLTDVVVVLLFSGTLALARALSPTGIDGGAAAAAMSVGSISWEILGALLVGALLGTAVAIYLRFVGEELLLFAVLAAFLGSEVARMVHVEAVLTLLTTGFVAENLSHRARGEALRHAMERSAAPVFVVFFALSGATIDVMAMVVLLPVLVPLTLVRGAAIWTGTRLGGRWARLPGDVSRNLWLGLVSQAGVAIGLASVVAEVFPTFGAELRTLLLALIALNQLVGPILFRRALVKAGEVPGLDQAPVVRPAAVRG
jgi:Kef-type K+ transport system membrane component KefB